MFSLAGPHGFRATFRTWAAEITNYPREVCEMALAHTLGSKVEAAYNRGDLLEKRRPDAGVERLFSNYDRLQRSPLAAVVS